MHRRGIPHAAESGANNGFMGNDCRECLAGLPHCHGTLIRHPGQHMQCTEPDCAHPEGLLHSLSIDCGAIGCECLEHDDQMVAV